MTDDRTIFALSSGAPPAGIAVVRVSGEGAGAALRALAGALPPPRRAVLRTLRRAGAPLDRALILWLPAPGTATGEDMAELHLHGGRAVVAAVEAALAALPGLRLAQAGEFTRRALQNGRMDLTAAEGLADLLEAETEAQRQAALAVESGGLARLVAGWRARLLAIAAEVEAGIEFAEEAETADLPAPVAAIAGLRDDLAATLAQPPAERLREGVRVVLAGPVNAGKSTLLNALVGRDAAIVTAIAGTTRDVLELPVAIEGRPFLFIDTAGLRDTDDLVEAEGIARARRAGERADILLWLGDDPPPELKTAIALYPRCDLPGRGSPPSERLAISARSGKGMDALRRLLLDTADTLLPRAGELAINARQRTALVQVAASLHEAEQAIDPILQAEALRAALRALDGIGGYGSTEEVLDSVFGRFCLGK